MVMDFHAKHGRGPTYPEMEQALGFRSRSWISYQLKELKAAGLVDWKPGAEGTLHPTVRRV